MDRKLYLRLTAFTEADISRTTGIMPFPDSRQDMAGLANGVRAYTAEQVESELNNVSRAGTMMRVGDMIQCKCGVMSRSIEPAGIRGVVTKDGEAELSMYDVPNGIRMGQRGYFGRCDSHHPMIKMNGGFCEPRIVQSRWLQTYPHIKAEGREVVLNDKSFLVCCFGGMIGSDESISRFDGGFIGDQSKIYLHIKELALKWNIDYDSVRWKFGDFVYWQVFNDDEFLHQEKLAFISQYKDVIKDAASEYDLPELLIAGVVYREYGGDPMVVDDVAYALRDFDWSGPDWIDKDAITSQPQLTSFGNVSIQVRRAWETLGYENEQITGELKEEIIESLKNPVENIYISAKHISDLRDLQYPGRSGAGLTENELIIVATRYNRGPDLSIEEIEKDTWYGKSIMENKTDIEDALKIEK